MTVTDDRMYLKGGGRPDENGRTAAGRLVRATPTGQDRRFEAAILAWDALAPSGPALGTLLEELCACGMEIAIVGGGALSDLDGVLGARPDGPGRLQLLVAGGRETYVVGPGGPRLRRAERGAPQDAQAWLLSDFWRRGIFAAQVVVAADDSAVALLEDQLRRRRDGAPPEPPLDTAWTVTFDGIDAEGERGHETLLTIADGVIGTTGPRLVPGTPANPRVLAAGIFAGVGPESHLVGCPLWGDIGVRGIDPGTLRRTLDLRTGTLYQEAVNSHGTHRAVVASSLRRPGTGVLRTSAFEDRIEHAPLVPSAGSEVLDSGANGEVWVRVAGNPGGVAAAASESVRGRFAERIAAFAVSPRGRPSPGAAVRKLRRARAVGFEHLIAEHRAAWARRWEAADVVIEGDPELQRGVRFSLFHLMASVAQRGEAAVGARGVSGRAYRGHVFWDSEAFVLPFLAATHAPSARAMLEYRLRRLPAARDIARRLGRRGARFPWESAHEGVDVTPTFVHGKSGEVIPIRTGSLEEHITADVAWAACFYSEWSGDTAFEHGPGRTLLVETARYWASRVRRENGAGRCHIYGVIGPDEYHEPVDDNAFTNVMARWNLRRAAELPGVDRAEREQWLSIADALVDGYDPATHLYEQFAGYYDLEPLLVAEFSTSRPVTADTLLGRARVQASQVLKQADVVLLHHLVPDEVAPGSLEPNLAFYEPRTAHGSSLSPAVYASLFARVGKLREAVELLRRTSRLDLDDTTSTTAEGLHMATMGGVWQALAFGFAGARARGGRLSLDPRLPDEWSAFELRLRYRGSTLKVRVEPGGFSVHASRPVALEVGGNAVRAARGGVRFRLAGERWVER